MEVCRRYSLITLKEPSFCNQVFFKKKKIRKIRKIRNEEFSNAVIENIPDFKQTVPKKVNELGSIQSSAETKVHTIQFNDDPSKAQQTAINWDSVQQSNEQVPDKIRLINPNSQFNGETSICDEPEKPTVAFDYEQVRKMGDITPLEKMTALQRKEVIKQQSLQQDKHIQQNQESNDAPSRITLDESSKGIVLNDKNRYLNHNVD